MLSPDAARERIDARARRDGCDCPPQVTDCTHVGDVRVCLGDAERIPCDDLPHIRFAVATVQGRPTHRTPCCDMALWDEDATLSHDYSGFARADAERQYDAAVARLLQEGATR